MVARATGKVLGVRRVSADEKRKTWCIGWHAVLCIIIDRGTGAYLVRMIMCVPANGHARGRGTLVSRDHRRRRGHGSRGHSRWVPSVLDLASAAAGVLVQSSTRGA